MKTCSECGIEKPKSEFNKRSVSPDGKDKLCKICRNFRQSAAYIPKPRMPLVSERGTKVCTKCKKEKYVSEFRVNRAAKSGLQSQCKKCRGKLEPGPKPKEGHKFCSKCKEEKPFSEFVKDKFQKSGLNCRCKKCVAPKSAVYRSDNLEVVRAKGREYNKKNQKEYNRKKNERLNNNPEFRLRTKVRCLFRQSFINRGTRKKESLFPYTGISMDEYVAHLKKDPLWNDYENKVYPIHLDHILGCVLFDWSNPDDIKKCWNPRNLRLLPASENLTKSKKFTPELVDLYQIHDLLPAKLTSI